MSICSTGLDDLGPLVVKPKIAWKMLNCSNTRGYELLAAGELESFLDGRSRKITVESIRRYIERKLVRPDSLPNLNPPPRRRGRPRKSREVSCSNTTVVGAI
jgi:hypothetical protein